MSNFKTKYYKALSYATGLMTVAAVGSELFIDGNLMDSVENPFIYGPLVFLIVLWLLLIVSTFTFLLFSSKEREKAFLIVSKTQVRDELEQKALSDAIQSTFILNIVILGLVYLLSGINISAKFNAETAKEKHVSIILEVPPKGYNDVIKKEASTEKTADDHKHINEKKLIPQSVYSPNGLFILILIQFLSFKLFLFLNRRALE